MSSPPSYARGCEQNHPPNPPTTKDTTRHGAPAGPPKLQSLKFLFCFLWGKGELNNSASQRWREAWAACGGLENEGS